MRVKVWGSVFIVIVRQKDKKAYMGMTVLKKLDKRYIAVVMSIKQSYINN